MHVTDEPQHLLRLFLLWVPARGLNVPLSAFRSVEDGTQPASIPPRVRGRGNTVQLAPHRTSIPNGWTKSTRTLSRVRRQCTFRSCPAYPMRSQSCFGDPTRTAQDTLYSLVARSGKIECADDFFGRQECRFYSINRSIVTTLPLAPPCRPRWLIGVDVPDFASPGETA